ncbi:hypothetical protein AS200_09695 [Streptomyces sp. CdTB01]|nr:hypothetical protein AS200_09695 [Streptomyces sp. CdTB01]
MPRVGEGDEGSAPVGRMGGAGHRFVGLQVVQESGDVVWGDLQLRGRRPRGHRPVVEHRRRSPAHARVRPYSPTPRSIIAPSGSPQATLVEEDGDQP